MARKKKFVAESMLLAALLLPALGQAAELRGAALQALAAGKKWVAAETIAGGNSGGDRRSAWTWRKDGSVCLLAHQGAKPGDCTDTGTWQVKDHLLCYQLTWWMKSYQLTSACMSVTDLGGGEYEAVVDGKKFLQFRVAQ